MTKTNSTFQQAWRRMVVSPAVATVIGAGLVLSACGGGGGDSSSPAAAANGDPSGAGGGGGSAGADSFATTDAFIALVQKLVASSDDTSEPLSVADTAAAPASDTTEPAATGS